MAGSTSRARIWATLIALAIAWTPGAAFALQPPRRGELKKYVKDGTIETRIENGLRSQHVLANPRLIKGLNKRLLGGQGKTDAGIAGAVSTGAVTANADSNAVLAGAVPSACGGLPATGTRKAFVLLVEFPDSLHNETLNSQASVQSKFFSDGDSLQAPYESVRNYYYRSSYGKLTIQGTVFAWYQAQLPRHEYEAMGDSEGRETLIVEALDYIESHGAGHDFSQYDTDGDGEIDAFYVKWMGLSGGYGSFWWSDTHLWESHPTYTVDGKTLGLYVWSPIASYLSSVYAPRGDIHETGHLLGLPDLWDKDVNVGPDGGVGGLDMMDGSLGDHNCFSKYLLGWLTPKAVISGANPQSLTLTLSPSATSEDCVLMMSGGDTGSKYGEFFMAQYRKPVAGSNDSPLDFPGTGLLIWHIDSTLQATANEFEHNNWDTEHKYIRLMEADGLEQIEWNAAADANDFYNPGDTFNARTKPDNREYGGLSSGVTVDEIAPPGETLTARFGVLLKPEIKYESSSLGWESCPTDKGYMDPFEHVNLNVTLRNIGVISTTNLVATLEPDGPVKTYGVLGQYARVSQAYGFTVSGTCGNKLTVSLDLKDGQTPLGTVTRDYPLGKPIATFFEDFDLLEAGQLPCGWTISFTVGEVPPGSPFVKPWMTMDAVGSSPPNSVFAAAPAYVTDNSLISPAIPIVTDAAILRFEHRFALEKYGTGYDGGVLEIKIGDENFVDITTAGGVFTEGGYNGLIVESGHGSPIAGRYAWTGNSTGFITTIVSLPSRAAGQNVQFQWRLGTDDDQSDPGSGWYVDAIKVYDGTECCTSVPGDIDGDNDVDQEDFGYLQRCFTGESVPLTDPACKEGTPRVRSIDDDSNIGRDDLKILLDCWSGPNVPATLGCWP